MMRINYRDIYLLILLVILSGCPHKEIYKPMDQISHVINGLKITPMDVFFHSDKGIESCDISLKIENQTDSSKEVIFSKSYLINSSNTLSIEKIYALGSALPIENIFRILPKNDTVLGFMFKGFKKDFGDTLKVVVDISGSGNNIFIYKRVKK